MTEWNGIKAGSLYKRTGPYADEPNMRSPIIVLSIRLTALDDKARCTCDSCSTGNYEQAALEIITDAGKILNVYLRMKEGSIEWAGKSAAQQEGSGETIWPYKPVV
jgi:hypothetical protein